MFVTLGFYRHAAFLFWRSQYRFTFTSYMFKSWTVKMHTDKRSSTCVFKHPLVLFFDWNSCVQLVKIQNLPIHIQTHTYAHIHEQYVWAKNPRSLTQTFSSGKMVYLISNQCYIYRNKDSRLLDVHLELLTYECITKDVLLYFLISCYTCENCYVLRWKMRQWCHSKC